MSEHEQKEELGELMDEIMTELIDDDKLKEFEKVTQSTFRKKGIEYNMNSLKAINEALLVVNALLVKSGDMENCKSFSRKFAIFLMSLHRLIKSKEN